jgi:hypothetical protein
MSMDNPYFSVSHSSPVSFSALWILYCGGCPDITVALKWNPSLSMISSISFEMANAASLSWPLLWHCPCKFYSSRTTQSFLSLTRISLQSLLQLILQNILRTSTKLCTHVVKPCPLQRIGRILIYLLECYFVLPHSSVIVYMSASSAGPFSK